MNPDYSRGLQDGHHAATIASLIRAARTEEDTGWFWLVGSIAVFILNASVVTPSSWLGLVVWGICAAAAAYRVGKNRRIRKALLAEIVRWKADQPEAAAVLHDMNSRANGSGNNNKGEEV